MALTQISTAGVKDDAVTSGKIPANAVGSSELADNAVDTNAIQDDAVTADKLANSINSAIAANTAKTTNATHTGDVTGSGSLTIASGAVTEAKLATNAVTADKINSGVITNAKLAANAVGTANIADEAVTLAKLPHGDGSSNGKFLRANNGADPSFETVSTDLVADTSPQLGGDLQSNGNNILMADNDVLVCGSGTDLKIFHDGSHSVIKDQGTGNLKLVASVIQFKNAADNETMLEAHDNGQVDIYNNDSRKIRTQSWGVDISGNSQIDGSCHPYSDNHSDLGVSSNRWQDLYLSGNIYLGGTGSSNALSDYETGTWTPNVAGNGSGTYSTRNGHYVKIGSLVHIDFYIAVSNVSYGVSYFAMAGLPFAPAGDGTGSFMAKYHSTNNNRWFVLHTSSGNTTLYAYGTENGQNWEAMAADSTFEMIGTCTYRTNS